jgi:hypothetical protein
MGKSQADQHMIKEGLGYKDINSSATKTYRKQFDGDEWPPAKHLPDSKAPPAGFGANLAKLPTAFCGTQAEVLLMIQGAPASVAPITKTWTHGEILALIKTEQNQGGSGIKSGTCHNYGESGHWSRECPKRRDNSGRNRPPNWKKVAPAVGATSTKVSNGKTFNWCSKCGRWTTTHATASHTGGCTDEASANLVFSIDPSAWHADTQSGITFQDLWNLVRPYILMAQYGFLILKAPVFVAFLVVIFRTIIFTLWKQGVNALAPLCWLIGLLATLWMGLTTGSGYDDNPPEPRWK